MSEFENSMMMVKRVLRAEFLGGSILIAGGSVYHGVITGAWTGAALFAGGAMMVLTALVWLMRLKTEAQLKKVLVD